MLSSIKLSRKQLFEDIWDIGFDRTAEKYDVSLNEMLEVCKMSSIPLPYNSYFADKFLGREVNIPKLPPCNIEFVELNQVRRRRGKIDTNLSSKANAICILIALEEHSDASKPMSVGDIINYLDIRFNGLKVDRRTVYSTIKLLQDIGYDISATKNGSKNYYALLDKTLEPLEAKLIMDSVMLNPLISPKTIDEINNKINKYLAKRSPAQRTWGWKTLDKFIEKYDFDQNLYFTLDAIDAALEYGEKLEFDYIKYDTNGKEIPFKNEKFVVTPCMIKSHNFTYYLLAEYESDNFVEFRLDRMRNVRSLDEKSNGKKAVGNGVPIEKAGTCVIRLQSCVTLKCDIDLLDKITDDFASKLKHITFENNNDGKTFNITLFESHDHIANWAASVCDKCEVIEPLELREAVIEKIKNNKYGV